MTNLERRRLKRICKRIVVQGYDHKDNVTEYYRMMQEAVESEFTEDNKPTLNGFLDDCYAQARRSNG
jgi:hypothetical protein